jgi:hypothetical protein
MEIITLDSDIKIYYVTAKSYPDGILEAFQKLHSLIPFSEKRKYISVSRPENKGEIVYRAGASELEEGDLSKHGLESLVISRGKYIVSKVENYKNNLLAIGKTFETLIHQPNIDPHGYCVEWYISHNDVKCMVKLID